MRKLAIVALIALIGFAPFAASAQTTAAAPTAAKTDYIYPLVLATGALAGVVGVNLMAFPYFTLPLSVASPAGATLSSPAAAAVTEEGLVTVLSAGTSDLPVALEAVVTARAMGARVESIFDVGVAGIHRLLAYREQLRAAHVVVVAAGMEGALASVVGGLVQAPVIAVPTSIGYGASFHGLAALLSMLNSCAAGVLVVNIDNGFGAGYSAAVINHQTVTRE